MRLRVLEVLATLKRAGAEQMAVSLASRLDRTRFDCTVVALYDPFEGGLEPVLHEHGIPARNLGKRRGFDPRIYPRLARLLREWRPNVIHTHSYIQRYVFPASIGCNARAIVHTVHNLAEKEVEPFGRLVHRIAYRGGVRAVAVSEEVARSFHAVYGFPPCATIPNGIDTSAYRRPEVRDRWRAAHGFTPEDTLIVSAARLEPQKNPLALIDAFARVARERTHLLIAGDGSLRRACEEATSRRGLEDWIHLLGIRDDVPDLLAAADLFALASDWEGHPLSVMEAMAAGLPVVATGVGGVPELVRDGESGLLVPANDPQALASALKRLIDAPGERRAMGEAAALQAERFSVDAMVAAYAALFEKLAGEPR